MAPSDVARAAARSGPGKHGRSARVAVEQRPARQRKLAGLQRQADSAARVLQQHRRRQSAEARGADDRQAADAARLADIAEQRLIQDARAGHDQERARLVEIYTPSIGRIARTYRGAPSISYPELMQAGVLGLLQALERYDTRRGTHFWAYASWYVRQAMQELVAELSGPVVLSDRAHRQLALVVQTRVERQQADRSEPTPGELSASTGLARAKVERLLAARQMPRSLDAPFRDDGDSNTSPADALADRCAESSFERVVRHDDIERLPTLLGHLSEREQTILSGRFGLGQPELTLAQLGVRLGVSAERIRQVEEAALIKLRHLTEAG
jgi:RNA polymerase primary sigma factor